MTVKNIDVFITIKKTAGGKSDLPDLIDNLIQELNLHGFNVDEDNKEKSIIPTAILVKLINSDAIESFTTTITGWLTKDRSRTLKFQIGDKQLEATGLSKLEQQDLIKWFQIQAGISFNK